MFFFQHNEYHAHKYKILLFGCRCHRLPYITQDTLGKFPHVQTYWSNVTTCSQMKACSSHIASCSVQLQECLMLCCLIYHVFIGTMYYAVLCLATQGYEYISTHFKYFTTSLKLLWRIEMLVIFLAYFLKYKEFHHPIHCALVHRM